MLPAYVTYFVGTNASGSVSGTVARLRRAAMVGLVTTAGFIVVFSIVGFLVSSVTSAIYDYVPWLSIVIGVALAALGLAMARGFEPKLSLPKVGRAREGTGLGAMFAYGLSYATVSISCTLPLFIGNVSTSVNTTLIHRTLAYVAYALGMGLVLVVVSLAAALAQQAFIRNMRRALPYINRVSGLLLLLTGAYVAYYGYYAYRVNRGDNVSAGPVDIVTRWSSNAQSWVTGIGTGWLITALAAAAVTVVSLVFLRGARPRTARGDTFS